MFEEYLKNSLIKSIVLNDETKELEVRLVSQKMNIVDIITKIQEIDKKIKIILEEEELPSINFDFKKNIFIEFEDELKDYEKDEYLYEFICEKIKESKVSNSFLKKFTLSFKDKVLSLEFLNDKVQRVIENFLNNYQTFLVNIGFAFDEVKSTINPKKFKTTKVIKKRVLPPISPVNEEQIKNYSSFNNETNSGGNTYKRRYSPKKIIFEEYSKMTENDFNAKKELKKKTFSGEIFSIQEKKYSNGKGKLFAISLHNHHENKSVNAIKFTNRLDEVLSFKKGDTIKVYGNYKKDNYTKDILSFQMIVDLLMEEHETEIFEREVVVDKRKRDEFHLHTSMSSMDGVGVPKDFFKEASLKNINSLTITDHNSVQAFPSAFAASKNYPNIKLNYGVEFDVIDDINTVIVRNEKDLKILNAEMVFFDIEATGLSSFVNEIIEFGALEKTYDKEGNEITKLHQFFVQPSIPIPTHITEITNISDQDLKEGTTYELKEALLKIKAIFKDKILVAHNADYDIGFLNNLFIKNGIEEITNPVIDTLKLSWLLNPTAKKHRLGAFAKKNGVEYDEIGAHRADYDSEVLFKIFSNIENDFKKEGIVSLIDINKRVKEIYPKLFPKHLSILAKNQEGLKELFKLVSIAHVDSFNASRKSPLLLLSTILEMRKNNNILLGSACNNGFLWEEINNGLDKEFIFNLYDYYEIFPKAAYSNLVERNYFTEVQIEKVIKEIIALGKAKKKLVIVSGDVHYPSEEDHLSRTVYILNKGLGGRRHPLFNFANQSNVIFPEVHLRSVLQMEEEFSFLDKKLRDKLIIKNPKTLNDLIEPIIPIKDKLYPPNIENSQEKFFAIFDKNLKDKYGEDPHPVIKARIKRELDSIIGNGYLIIYYLSSLAVRKSLEDGYLVGSRGSVGSSLVATLADITEVNPLPPHYYCPKCKKIEFDNSALTGYDLPKKKCSKCKVVMQGEGNDIPFETFLGFNGDKVPDIDLNFSGEYQGKIHDYIKELLSEEKVFRAGTISTVASKTAYGYVRNFLEATSNTTFQKADIEYLTLKVEGTKRTTGQHPGGLIIVPPEMDVYDFTPINFPGNDVNSAWKTTHFDFHSIHDNLLKLDFLGHLDPTVLKMLAEITNVDPKTISLEDKDVISLFASTDKLQIKYPEILDESLGILGIPEFGTSFVRELVRDASPKTFSDLVKISGLSHGTDVWLGNAKNLIVEKVATLEEVISVRDDIMTFLISKGLPSGEAFKIMESVRKGKGLTGEWEKLMLKHNVPLWYVDSCKKIKYMFPKAHATAYVIMAFRIAWFKINYPLHYYAAFFTKRDTEFDWSFIYTVDDAGKSITREIHEIYDATISLRNKEKRTDKENGVLQTLEIVNEFLSRGFQLAPINLEKSTSFDWIVDEKNNQLIPPFIIVDGLGDVVAKNIVEQRTLKPYLSKEDFKKRSSINNTQYGFFESNGILVDLLSEVKTKDNKIKQKSFNL